MTLLGPKSDLLSMLIYYFPTVLIMGILTAFFYYIMNMVKDMKIKNWWNNKEEIDQKIFILQIITVLIWTAVLLIIYYESS